jgi:hypothetical protein
MGCFLDSHDTIPIPKCYLYPEEFFLSSILPIELLAVYPISLKSYEVEYIIPNYFVPFTYLIILLPSFQRDYFGVSMNL